MRIAWLVLALIGCDAPLDRVEVVQSDGAVGALSAKLGKNELTLDGALSRDGPELIVRAHLNHALDGGAVLARDGPDGAFVATTSRSFVLRWPDGEVERLLAQPRFVELDVRASKSGPTTLGARLVFGLRVEDASSGARLDPALLASDVLDAALGGDAIDVALAGDGGTVTLLGVRVIGALERLALGEGDPRRIWPGMD
jgi:hypothetical protein